MLHTQEVSSNFEMGKRNPIQFNFDFSISLKKKKGGKSIFLLRLLILSWEILEMTHLAQRNLWNRLSRAVSVLLSGHTELGSQWSVGSWLSREPHWGAHDNITQLCPGSMQCHTTTGKAGQSSKTVTGGSTWRDKPKAILTAIAKVRK